MIKCAWGVSFQSTRAGEIGATSALSMPKGICSRIRNGSGNPSDHGSDRRLPGLSSNGSRAPSNGDITARARRKMTAVVTEDFMFSVGMAFDTLTETSVSDSFLNVRGVGEG